MSAAAAGTKRVFYELIENKLKQRLNPSILKIIDESKYHAGHNELAATIGETHFKVQIVSNEFKDMNRVERHRLVYDILSEEIEERVHALKIEAKTPEEGLRKKK